MNVHLVGDRVQHLVVGELTGVAQRRVERSRTAFPVEESAGLLDGRCDREHDVGVLGDRAGPDFQADDERHGLQRRSRRLGIRQVVGVDGADDNAQAMGLKPLISGTHPEDEALYLKQHGYWAQVMARALAAEQDDAEVPA